ncbi:hypothetical protein [Siminovitchia fortis]|uniref:hypothetical protein n=1 Tax=Siminovitchia fortis TaxID=254758 RepID=UPI0011A4BBD9|nr:hypothetical protein [Siminovitchia fortis]
MKKYSVYIVLSNGQDIQFETNTNIKMQMPINIGGGKFIITEEEHVINVDHIKELDIVQLR